MKYNHTISNPGLPETPTSPKIFGEHQKSPSSQKIKGPKPTITKKFENIEVNEGENVALEVTSGPEPVTKVEWFKDNELLRDQGRFKIVSQGNVYKLLVSPIEWDDEGMYKCVLLNEFGLSSCSAEVLVEDASKSFFFCVVSSREERTILVVFVKGTESNLTL